MMKRFYLFFLTFLILTACNQEPQPEVVDPPNPDCTSDACLPNPGDPNNPSSPPDPNNPGNPSNPGDPNNPGNPTDPTPPQPSLCDTVGTSAAVYRPVSMQRQFASSSSFKTVYAPGDSVNSNFCFELMDGTLDLTQAVLRFDIVNTSGQSVLQQNSAIIDTNSFTLNPNLKEPRTFFSKSRMEQGVIVQGSFRFVQNAPAGEYRTVISVVPTQNNNVPAGSVAPVVAFNFPFRLE
jgi:hypothetical protein